MDDPSALAALAELHASLLIAAREAERMDHDGNPHAERERMEARNCRAQAAALANLLRPHGVQVPDPRQLALWSDGR